MNASKRKQLFSTIGKIFLEVLRTYIFCGGIVFTMVMIGAYFDPLVTSNETVMITLPDAIRVLFRSWQSLALAFLGGRVVSWFISRF